MTRPNKKTIEGKVAAMSDAEVRTFAVEVGHENRRLRVILDAIAKADEGRGAVVEFSLYTAKNELSYHVNVVAPSGDEEALCGEIYAASAAVLEKLGILFGPTTGKAEGSERLKDQAAE